MKSIYSHKSHKAARAQKHSTRSLLPPTPDNYWKQPYNSISQSRNIRLNHPAQDTKSIIEKLIQTTDLPYLQLPAPIDPLRNRKLLVDTEGRIFTEVLRLMDQIDSLRTVLTSENELIRKLKIENPEVEVQVRYHGFAQKLTVQQCKDLEDENAELQRMIGDMQSRQVSSLEQVLRAERNKYQELKMGLLESRQDSEGRMEESHINELKHMVSSLRTDRETKLESNCPEIESLKKENEELRQKTMQNLQTRSEQQQEQSQLQAYLRQEQRSQDQFMEQLQIFRGSLHKMKAENVAMRERLNRLRHEQSKENNSSAVNVIKIPEKSLPVESRFTKKIRSESKNLSEYESIIRKMQSLNR